MTRREWAIIGQSLLGMLMWALLAAIIGGWLLNCGGVDRQACYASADAWLTQRAAECERTEGAWSTCTTRKADLAEHSRRYVACP